MWTRNASAPTTLELTQGGKEEASGSDRKAFCFSRCHCRVLSRTLPCSFSECYVALTVELCALTFRHRDCPRTALHCAALQSSWTRIGRRRCRVSGRHCCCLARLGAPGGCSRDQAGANRTPGSTFYCSVFLAGFTVGRPVSLQPKILQKGFISSTLLKLILNMVVMNDLKASKLHERAQLQRLDGDSIKMTSEIQWQAMSSVAV